MKKFAASALLASSIVCGSVTAAPTLTALSGTVAQGSTVTVTGSGFGTFGGAIVSWDDFEAQTVGAPINGSRAPIGGTWTTQYNYTGSGARFDGTKVRSGALAAHLDWSRDSNTIRAFGWAGRGPFSKLYITYWRQMQGDYVAGTGFNHKQFYLFGNGRSELPQLMPVIPGGASYWSVYNNSGMAQTGTQSNANNGGWTYENTVGVLQRWEFWFVLNDVNAENGVVKVWKDGELGVNNSKYNIRQVDGQFKDFRLGHMAQGFNSTAKAWFDDLYIATTPARVELCDQPVWSNCTDRDIQVVDPTSWSDRRISFTLRNAGSTPLAGRYLYVIDSNGVANTNGLPISSERMPQAPSSLLIE